MASFYGFLVLLACVSSGFGQDNDKQPSCTTVKMAYRLKRLAESDVPQAAVDGDDLRVCPKDNGKQCCSQRMEVRFGSLVGNDFDKSASSKVREIRGLINEQAKTFDGMTRIQMLSTDNNKNTDDQISFLATDLQSKFMESFSSWIENGINIKWSGSVDITDYFRGLIKKSQQELHTMFVKIYGSHYVQNTKIFMDLFVELTRYYNGATSSDVSSIMNTFFKNLMRRMFEIMNGQYQFTSAYLDCVSQHMEKLAPFGDVPEKLTPQVRKVMIYARTFTQALHAGREVIHSLENAISSKDCKNQLIKMKYCSWCKAMTSLKPCFKFCTDVHKDCLADVAKVNTQWQRYVTALNDLLEKQAGATNIHDVMTRLHLKISFAIMNFQTEKSKDVKTKVFQAKECGSPGRTKRSTDDFFLEGNSRQRRDDEALARTSSEVNLDRLTTDYKAKMKVADNFWMNLPERMCGDISAKDKNSDCWNGVGKGSYTSPDDGGNNVEGDPTAIVTKAIAKLKELEDQLIAAKDGDDVVNVIDNDDDDDEEGSSGSGSGSGSGESGENVIPDYTEKPITSENDVDDKKEDENVMGGGLGQPNAGAKENSASRHAMGEWLLCSLICVLSLALRA